MPEETRNESITSKPDVPGYKKFGAAKLVPPPAPIQQGGDEEKFPVFLGVGIALSMLALFTIFILSFFSQKTKIPPPNAAAAAPSVSASAVSGTAAAASPSPATSAAPSAH